MSDFIASNLHKKVDTIMDAFYGAGVASHPTIIEQINYLLFMRALSQRDDELRLLGVNNPNEIIFDGDLEKYHWANLLTLNAEELFIALEECFLKIPESTTNKTVRLVFRNAHIKLFDKPSLRTILHQIDEFGKTMDESEHAGRRDVFGDTYEYLLSKLAQAGTSGQFRTPRHIIEFIVNVVAPKKGETIIDPAVGTAGFLVKAFEYLRKEYTTRETFVTGGSFDQLNNTEHTFLLEHTFTGFDSDEDMIKFGMMNLYLHGLKDAKLLRQNTLTDTAGSRDKYDIILANPPFSGKIDRNSVAEELQMNTGATEVLFLRYILRHLNDNGRAGVIVPEGVIFNANGAYTKIRELLLENGLWCVVSLPAGVFNPYSGVKTSVLFIDKQLAKKFNRVIFITATADGFDLSANRRPIMENDLPNIEKFLGYCKAEIEKGNIRDNQYFPFVDEDQSISIAPLHYTFEKVERIKDDSNASLQSGRYDDQKEIQNSGGYPIVELGSIAEINPQKIELKNLSTDLEVSFAPMADLNEHHPDFIPSSTRRLGEVRTGYTYFKDNDVLLAKVTPCFENGKAGIAAGLENGIGFGSSEYYILRATDKILPRYLYQILMNQDFRIAGESVMTGTGGLRRVPKSFLESYKIALPPIEVQYKIVNEIENKQKAIDHAHEAIATLEKEKDDILNRFLG